MAKPISHASLKCPQGNATQELIVGEYRATKEWPDEIKTILHRSRPSVLLWPVRSRGKNKHLNPPKLLADCTQPDGISLGVAAFTLSVIPKVMPIALIFTQGALSHEQIGPS